MSKVIKFGENVEGYEIPVLNEREIRAAAGILFVWAFLAVLTAIMKGSFVLLKYFILAFLVDFIIRVFINPKFSPTLIIGRLIVRRQTPEYVGAAQKKFAWVIGLILVLIMLVLVVFVNSYSPITGIICLICLIFLLFESAFGICLGLPVLWLVLREESPVLSRRSLRSKRPARNSENIMVADSDCVGFYCFHSFVRFAISGEV